MKRTGVARGIKKKKSNFKEKDCCIKNVRQFGTAVWSAMANIYCKGERFFIHVFSSQIMSFRGSNNLSTEKKFYKIMKNIQVGAE